MVQFQKEREPSFAEKIRKALVKILGQDAVCSSPLAYGRGRFHLWNVEYDRSAGWEVKSPILSGHEGVVELSKVCGVLQDVATEQSLRLNHKTGLHIHLGWNDPDILEIGVNYPLWKSNLPGLTVTEGRTNFGTIL